MPFLYLRDPLFLVCVALYGANRLLVEPFTAASFFHNHFNDLICIPFLVPIMLYGARVTGLRRHDRGPLTHEVIAPLIVWSILFEIVFPGHPFWGRYVVGDPYDIVYYSVGAAAALSYWTMNYHLPGRRRELADRNVRVPVERV